MQLRELKLKRRSILFSIAHLNLQIVKINDIIGARWVNYLASFFFEGDINKLKMSFFDNK
jgi:hypothetical protein